MANIRVEKETHGKLLRILGEMQSVSEKRVTLDKAIQKLIEVWRNNNGK